MQARRKIVTHNFIVLYCDRTAGFIVCGLILVQETSVYVT